MKNLIASIFFMVIGGLILIQQDTDGSLLVNGWHGLALASLASLIAACTFLIMGIYERDNA